MTAPDRDPRFEDARQLWAGRFQAVLTTHSVAEQGYPFGSMVPYCLDRDGQALLLLSHLAQHTKNLNTDARCGLCVAEGTDGDVQQSLRLSCVADAEPVDPSDRASHARWFRYFPASRPYAEQLNFRLYRIRPRRFHFNGGFAAARWLGQERILWRSPLGDEEELSLLRALEDLTTRLTERMGASGAPTRPVGIDPWGLDLAQGERLTRVPLTGPLTTLDAVRAAVQAALAERWPAPTA